MPFLPDIGLGELLLVGLVALFIVGPERLPTVMRTLGVWCAHARHLVQGMTSGWGLYDSEDKTTTQKTKEQPTKSKK